MALEEFSNSLNAIAPDGSKVTIPFEQKEEAEKQGYSIPVPGIHAIAPDGSKVTIPFEQRRDALEQKYTIPSEQGNLSPSDPINIQDEQGKLILRQRGSSDNILHLSPEDALPLLASGHLEANDPAFQAMIDNQRDYLGKGRLLGAGILGAADSIPIVGSILKKLKNYSVSNADVPEKAMDIASEINKKDPDSPEGIAQGQGQFLGNVGTAAASLSPSGLIGEGLLATKAAGAIEVAGNATELMPLATKALTGIAKGGAYSLPYVADQLINNDPNKAAETALLSMGVGALLHVSPAAFNSALASRVASAAAELPNAASSVIEEAGLKSGNIPNQVPFIRDLLKQSPNIEDIGQSLKNLATGDHMVDLIPKFEHKVETSTLIGNLEQLRHITGASEQANNELTNIINKLDPKAEQTSIQNLQKISKDLINGIYFAALKSNQSSLFDIPKNEITNLKLNALDTINKTFIDAGDISLAKAVQAGDPKAAKLAEEWSTAKETQDTAQKLLFDYVQKTAEGKPTELTALGQVLKNITSSTGAGIQTKIQNPGIAILNSIPILRSMTNAPAAMADAVSNTISKRSAFFDTMLAAHPNSWLIKNANNPKIGTFFALDSIASNNAKIAEIPGYLKDLGSKAPAIFSYQKDPIVSALGAEASGLSKDQQIQRLSDKISEMQGSPDVTQTRINNLIQPLATDHPEMALHAQQLASIKLAYINQLLHPQKDEVPTAFQTQKKQSWTPAQVQDIKDQLAVISNPYVILGALAKGTLTTNQIKAAQITSPAIFAEIQQTINKEAYTGDTKLTYQQRISASKITGQPLDPTLNNVSQLQMGFGGQAPQPANQPPQKGHKAKAGHKLDSDAMPDNQTLAQRISGK